MKAICILLCVSMLVLPGCATMLSGSTQSVSFSSSPSGATVMHNGRALGQTPLQVNIDRGEGGNVTFAMEGYSTASVPMQESVNWTTGWNLFTFWILGFIVDAVSGSLWKYSPDSYHGMLTPAAPRYAGGRGEYREEEREWSDRR